MTTTNETRSVTDVVKGGDVAMVTTTGGGHLSSRPLTVAEAGSGYVSFLIDVTADWAKGTTTRDEVNVAIAASGRNDWVSITGPAIIGRDPATIERLWSPAASAYFDGPDDEKLGVLQVSVDIGEYWSAPGGGAIGRLVSLLGSAVGQGDKTADHGAIARD